MADVVNLRQARKALARRTAAEDAAENRARHGRTRAERAAQTAQAERATRLLAGHQRDESD